MSTFAAQAHVALADPEAVIEVLCRHMREHGARVTERDGTRILDFHGAQARFSRAGAVTVVDAAAASIEALYYVRSAVASHLLEFCAAPAPVIEWRGDGADLLRPPNFRILEVMHATTITPHMRRITFTGDDLARFAPLDALHLNILIQHPGRIEPQWPRVGPDGLIVWDDPQRRPSLRKYTVRRVDPAAGTLDIDFVLHADAGPGSALAERARPGDRVGVLGPGGGGLVAADWYLFAGDETALPAIARMLAHLPGDARGHALIEVAHESEIQELACSAAIDVTWLYRNGHAPGTTSLLPDAVRQVVFPADGSRVYVWAACEFDAFRAIRAHLRKERGLKKHEHLAVSYWRRGHSDNSS